MMLKSLVITIIISIQLVKCDDYVEETLQKCNTSGVDCDKYRLLKFLEDFDFEWKSNGIVNLIRIPLQEVPFSLPEYRSEDAEYVKFFKFLRRKVILFLGTHTLALQLPEQFDVIQGRSLNASETAEDKSSEWSARARRKRQHVYLIPILIFAKMVKIMFLLGLVFSSLIAVKKIILIGAFVFPIILKNIKTACTKKEEHYYPVQTVEDHGWWRSEAVGSGILQFLTNLVTSVLQSSSGHNENLIPLKY